VRTGFLRYFEEREGLNRRKTGRKKKKSSEEKRESKAGLGKKGLLGHGPSCGERIIVIVGNENESVALLLVKKVRQKKFRQEPED